MAIAVGDAERQERPRRGRGMAAVLLSLLLGAGATARAFDVVLNAQGEFLDAYPIDGSPQPRRLVFIGPDPPQPDNLNGPRPRVGRHVNGKLCFFPRGLAGKGKFVIADDTYR